MARDCAAGHRPCPGPLGRRRNHAATTNRRCALVHAEWVRSRRRIGSLHRSSTDAAFSASYKSPRRCCAVRLHCNYRAPEGFRRRTFNPKGTFPRVRSFCRHGGIGGTDSDGSLRRYRWAMGLAAATVCAVCCAGLSVRTSGHLPSVSAAQLRESGTWHRKRRAIETSLSRPGLDGLVRCSDIWQRPPIFPATRLDIPATIRRLRSKLGGCESSQQPSRGSRRERCRRIDLAPPGAASRIPIPTWADVATARSTCRLCRRGVESR